MVSPTKLARMDAKVRTFLAKEFASAPNSYGQKIKAVEKTVSCPFPA
jgi:hypothetical protein